MKYCHWCELVSSFVRGDGRRVGVVRFGCWAVQENSRHRALPGLGKGNPSSYEEGQWPTIS